MGRARSLALSLSLGAAVVYLAGHAVTGKHGLIAHWDLQKQEAELQSERDALRAERLALEARAARLKPSSLDLDYLDERARALLASGDPDELVFVIEPAPGVDGGA